MRQTLDQSSQIVFIDKTTTCSYGTVQYLTENVTTGHFSVTREFAKDVCSLPAVMTTSGVVNYMQFLDKWGTVRRWSDINELLFSVLSIANDLQNIVF
jgi:hypothetical protein